MSGIVGILNLDGAPVDRSLLERMTEFMTFRGPDAQKVWLEGAVGFGHTMLRTTWEAEYEHQPFTLDQQVWIVADARIDDREVLAQKLEVPFKPLNGGIALNEQIITDVEFVLRAYLKWGEDCVQHLLGDFAFAIWDSRQQRLFCARDQFGVKLFYYSRVGNCLILSNTLNCIRQHPKVSAELNEAAIADFLLFQRNFDLETTTFTDIQRLPPAHKLLASVEKGIQTQRYWTLPMPELIRYKRSEDYIDRFKELMGQAVGDRLRTERVSSFFSGGLDSTTIAAIALTVAKQKSQPLDLQAFTIVYDELIPDREQYYAGLAADALGIPLDCHRSDDYYPYQDVDIPELQTPEPSHDPFAIKDHELFKRSARHSRVGFSGQGGDESLAPTTVAEMLQTMPFFDVGLDVGRCCFSYGIQPHWGSGFLSLLRRWQQPEIDRPEYPAWLNPDFARRLELKARWDRIMGDESAMPLRSPRSRAYNKSSSVLWANYLERNESGFTGLPIEMRFPFIDLRLLSYLLALPPMPWCVNKMLLRLSMKEDLPDEVRLRPKTPLAGDPLTAKGVHIINEASILRGAPSIENFVSINHHLLHRNNTLMVWQCWQSLVPLSLAYWLHRY
jgi:asparagine synthase (glutamine-hydrolysing)